MDNHFQLLIWESPNTVSPSNHVNFSVFLLLYHIRYFMIMFNLIINVSYYRPRKLCFNEKSKFKQITVIYYKNKQAVYVILKYWLRSFLFFFWNLEIWQPYVCISTWQKLTRLDYMLLCLDIYYHVYRFLYCMCVKVCVHVCACIHILNLLKNKTVGYFIKYSIFACVLFFLSNL